MGIQGTVKRAPPRTQAVGIDARADLIQAAESHDRGCQVAGELTRRRRRRRSEKRLARRARCCPPLQDVPFCVVAGGQLHFCLPGEGKGCVERNEYAITIRVPIDSHDETDTVRLLADLGDQSGPTSAAIVLAKPGSGGLRDGCEAPSRYSPISATNGTTSALSDGPTFGYQLVLFQPRLL